MTSTTSIQIAEQLLREYALLATLDCAAQWKGASENCIVQLLTDAEACNGSIAELRTKAARLRSETRQRSFWGRFFKSAEEKQAASSIATLTKATQSLRETADDLQEKIDDTPSNRDEKTRMLNELKVRKKELQLEKRELSAHMKNIRTEARQRSADAATSITALVAGSKYTAAERHSIRVSKEQALAPHEDAKASLERQLLALDREILRIESFS